MKSSSVMRAHHVVYRALQCNASYTIFLASFNRAEVRLVCIKCINHKELDASCLPFERQRSLSVPVWLGLLTPFPLTYSP